jgi:hypothetical protein
LDDRKAIDRNIHLEKELPQRKRAASPNELVMMREDTGICKSQAEKGDRALPLP